MHLTGIWWLFYLVVAATALAGKIKQMERDEEEEEIIRLD